MSGENLPRVYRARTLDVSCWLEWIGTDEFPVYYIGVLHRPRLGYADLVRNGMTAGYYHSGKGAFERADLPLELSEYESYQELSHDILGFGAHSGLARPIPKGRRRGSSYLLYQGMARPPVYGRIDIVLGDAREVIREWTGEDSLLELALFRSAVKELDLFVQRPHLPPEHRRVDRWPFISDRSLEDLETRADNRLIREGFPRRLTPTYGRI